MTAVNAVMANHVIETVNEEDKARITEEIIRIIASVQRNRTADAIIERLCGESRVVQTNFIALACENLGITPYRGAAWTKVKNPYLSAQHVNETHIDAAFQSCKRDCNIRPWPGSDKKIDFRNFC